MTGSSIPDLATRVTELAQARARAAQQAAAVDLARRAWLEANAELLTAAKETGGAVTFLEGQVRQLALQAYEVTGEKKPTPGISIRMETVVEYDPQEAFEWARSTRLCLQLDRAGFEAMAKTNPEVCHGVRVTQEPKATIARDLGAVLGDAAAVAGEPTP
jgi:hypothetical protein